MSTVSYFDRNRETASSRYSALESDRKPYTDRAEESAKYTIPMLFPKETDTSSTKYDTPYQSIGARGVNNLVAKLMLALFPPNSPFFRLSIGAEMAQMLNTNPEFKQKLEEALVFLENQCMNYMEKQQVRVTMYEALTQLIIAGNVLLFLPPAEGGLRVYRLNSYVVQRDGIGNVTEIVTKENIAYSSLSPEGQRCIQEDNINPSKEYEVYTHVYVKDDNYESYQEIQGTIVAGSENTYPKDKSAWIALRLNKMDGESYGRSFIDSYIGDLKALESLTKAIVEVASVSSNILFLVNPNSVTRVSDLAKAQSGAFVKGRAEDITTLQVNKTTDLQITTAAAQSIESRLSYAFLLNSAVQRNAERVTAEEIRYVARELEDTVGSIYSILAQELQLPLVKRVLSQMERLNLMPELPQGSTGIEPVIITGIEALGRGHDLTKLDTFIRYAQVFPEAFNTYIKQDEILRQIAASLSINADSVVKTQEEVMQAQQQQAGMDVAQMATANAIQNQM